MMEHLAESLVVITTLAATFIIYKTIFSSRANAPPSLPWLPIVGSLPFLSGLSTFHIFLMEKAKRYGNVYSFYAGQRYTVVLNGLNAIREALLKRSADFAGRDKVYSEQLVWNPDLRGLAFRQYDDDFKSLRKSCITVLKKFGFGERATMEIKIHDEINETIKYIREKNGKAFDITDVLRTSALSVICSLMFGNRIKLDDPTADYIRNCFTVYEKSLDPMLDLFPISRYFPTFRKFLKQVVKESHDFRQFIDEKLEQSLNSANEDEIFTKYFMTDIGEKFDKSEVYFVIKDFLTGGMYEPTSQMLWFILLVCNHPSIQERLHNELDSVVPRGRLPSLSDKLPYLEATILEVMRRNTAIPLALPHTTLCDTEVSGFSIPAGSQIVVNLWSVHMDPNVWPEPQQFRPERFLNDNGEVINQDKVVTFSMGKRRCPGEILARQEIFLNVASLLQQFQFLPPEGQTSIPDHGSTNLIYNADRFEVRFLPRVT